MRTTFGTTLGWAPGDHHGLAWDGGCALIEGTVPLSTATAVWSRMEPGGGLSSFLQALTDVCDGSLLNLPGFAVLVAREGCGHVAVRGRFLLEATSASGDVRCDGQGMTTWAERCLETIDVARLAPAEPDAAGPRAAGEERPLVCGVVPAGRLRWQGGSSRDEADPAASSAEADPEMDPAASLAEAEPEVTPVAADQETSSAESTPLPPPRPDTAVAPPDEVPEAPPRPADVPGPEPLGAEGHVGIPPPAPAGRFAQLWAEDTIMGPIQEAAVQPPEPSTVDTLPFGPPGRPEPESESKSKSKSKSKSGSEPGSVSSDATPQEDRDDPTGLADHDGQTIIRGLPVLTPPDGAPGSLAGVLCHAGHVNPPGRSRCRACVEPVGDQETMVAPGVPIGWVEASSGQSVELTGTIIVGRQPMAARIEGDRMPSLLALPFGHISGTHLEICVEGWSVFARDANSTNGTFLLRGQEPPQRVPEERIQLDSGDVLDLGHGVKLTFPEMA